LKRTETKMNTGNEFLEHDEPIVAAFPAHPGTVLKTEVLPARGVTGVALAAAIGAQRPFVTAMLNGRKGVSPAMALKIERAIGYPADLLVAMQGNFDLAETRRREADALERIAPIAATG